MAAANELSVSSLVNVQVNLASAPAQAQNLTNLLILGSSDIIDTTQRMRSYSTIAAVAADFGSSSFVCTTLSAAGQAVISSTNTTGVLVGQIVSGTGIPVNATVVSIVPNTSVTISANLTAAIPTTTVITAICPEYGAALEWFGQSPQPGYCLIGRWASTATSGRAQGLPLTASQQLLSNWTGITSSGFKISIDGAGAAAVTVGTLAGATSMASIAATVQAAVRTATTGTQTVTWNSTYGTFMIEGTSTGATSSIAITAPTSGTDLSLSMMISPAVGGTSIPGVALETAAQAVANFDNQFGQQWYAVFVIGIDADSTTVFTDRLAVAAYVQASNTKHAFGINSQDTSIITSGTTDVAYAFKGLGYTKTTVHYSGNSKFAVVAYLARILTTNYTANKTVITLMYKTEPGVIGEYLSTTAASYLFAKNCNVFTYYDNNIAIIQPGIQSNGDFTDTIFAADWYAITVQNTLFNLLYSNPTKIPQTDDGNNILVAGINQVSDQAVANGMLAPGVWTQAGFGTLNQGDTLAKGYYVYAPPVATQNSSDRAARKSVTFQVAAKLAGALHTVSCILYINR